MRTFLKTTHRAIVLLLGMGGVLSLFLWVNGWGQWVYVRGELDFEIGSQLSCNVHFDYNYPPNVNINTPNLGLDTSFDFAGIMIEGSQFGGQTNIFVVLPYWLLFALFSLYPVIYLIRRKRTATEGKCAKCGYDLRGSKHRCPECGLQFDNPPKRESQDATVSP